MRGMLKQALHALLRAVDLYEYNVLTRPVPTISPKHPAMNARAEVLRRKLWPGKRAPLTLSDVPEMPAQRMDKEKL